MPPRSWRFRLRDIRSSIRKIQSATEGHDRASFVADDLLVHAVLMHLVIIGEAAGRLPDEVTGAAPDVPWEQIRGLRNFIAHAYFALDLDMVWRTVIDDLGPLDQALADLEERLGADLD